MRSQFVKNDLVAISANNKETALNTEQTLDTGILADLESIAIWDRRLEDNSDEATGKEEPDALYDLGGLSTADLSFSKMQAQHMAIVGAFGLGVRSTVAAGSTGYRHTITPITGDLDALRSNPCFTLGMRYGKWLEKRRFASMFIDSFTLSLKKDSFASMKASIKGTGKNSTTLLKDSITAAWNATTLTLTAAASGSTAQERLDNCHYIRALDPVNGQWVDVVFSAVSGATPAIVTITAPGGAATSTTYEIIYNQAETGVYAWGAFPSRVSEPPLRCSDFLVNMGGKWDGTVLTGGHPMSADINSIDWTLNNGITPAFTPGGGTYSYANQALRDGRTQTIALDRQFKEFIVGQRFYDLSTFVLYAKAEGPEYEAGHKYTVEIVFPKVCILRDPYGRTGNRLTEKAEFKILEDDVYGSVVLYIKNKVATYAT